MAYPSIKIRALQAIIAVYEEQSFSRAADRENTTQSGMSTQVKGLELVLGTQLLVRERKKFALTPAGEIIYREGQAILKALAATEKAVQDLRGNVAGLVRFGMIPSLTRSVLIPALDQFKTEFPDVELSLLEEYSFSLMRRVLDGELDFALVPSTDLPAGLTGTFVGRDREMLVSNADLDLGFAHLDDIPLSCLNDKRLIVPSRLNVRRKHFDTLLNTHGIHVAEMLEMDGMLATLEMVGATDWVAILPSAICHPDKDGSVRRLNPIKDPPISLDYVLVEKAEMAAPRAARLLANCLVHHIGVILSDWQEVPDIENPEPAHLKL
ncbi:LysR family transcriptional regulator [Loktanella sp. DJP18]|uniref:LysR family transcriptional regulator n=1 Tax=Loktanella sp. DJP18 TaxID=3409788 RepID=UPI003BB4C7D7